MSHQFPYEYLPQTNSSRRQETRILIRLKIASYPLAADYESTDQYNSDDFSREAMTSIE